MANIGEVYKCAICGNVVLVVHGGAGELVCCGQPMKHLVENTVDAAKEKHVPVIEVNGDTVTVNYDDARAVFAALAAAGIALVSVTQLLEDEGVEKFIASWHELQDTVRAALADAPESAS